MMVFLFLAIAICGMVCGHVCKGKRWGLFISVYETPLHKNLLGALATGHAINALLPFRIGDVVRVGLSGKRLTNGYPLAIATVIADLYIDFICVGSIFLILALLNKGGATLLDVTKGYMILGIVIVTATFFCIVFRKLLKKIIQKVASIFNENFEFRVLYITYLTIASLKDIYRSINKKSLFMYSLGMWIGYVISYISFAEAIQKMGFSYTASDVFTTIFSGLTFNHTELSGSLMMGAYIAIPLVLCWIYSIIPSANIGRITRPTLPHVNQSERNTFLKMYYSDENRKNLKLYLEMNHDVVVICDNSAGSNATTITALKNDRLFYRKYAFNEDGEKLRDQILWIEKYQNELPLPLIIDKKSEKNIVSYDMPLLKGCIGFFEYIHTMPLNNSWNVIESVINDLQGSIFKQNDRINDQVLINQYLELKVQNNLQKIREGSAYIRNLERNQSIIVNGVELHTLNHFANMLSKSNLMRIFQNDHYCEIHGDLTIENIICIYDIEKPYLSLYEDKMKPRNYYLIDPNTGNIHDSPYLDYAKILQSLHGGYEFLTKVVSVDFGESWINFTSGKSENYKSLYDKYRLYLNATFSNTEVRSIYYHQIIHWLRLLPHQIEKNEKLSLVFYAQLLEILRDIEAFEYKK